MPTALDANTLRYQARDLWLLGQDITDDQAEQAWEMEQAAELIEAQVRAAGGGAGLVGPLPLSGHGVPEFDGLGHR